MRCALVGHRGSVSLPADRAAQRWRSRHPGRGRSQDWSAGQHGRLLPPARNAARLAVERLEVTHRWSGQVIETPDGLPYIGQSADHQYSATGFSGNGLTFGTLAGMMMADAVLGRTNPWRDLFDPNRKALTRGLWDYIKENTDYPYYLIRDRFAGAEGRSLREVKRGEGKILERNGAKVAAYRDADGAVTLRSAICTHMGCVVGWNAAERTWDCPCHGLRFKPTGQVISGPAESPLPGSRLSAARAPEPGLGNSTPNKDRSSRRRCRLRPQRGGPISYLHQSRRLTSG